MFKNVLFRFEAIKYTSTLQGIRENSNLFVLLTQYCAGDKIEKNEMGWACGAYG